MKPLLPALLLGLGLSTATGTPAAAYPVDCAILLCLAGGWPASAECAHARAVFIRRITPWPIEPPLQIWNCPMRASFRNPISVERPFDIEKKVQESEFPISKIKAGPRLQVLDKQADIDISDPAFEFVRSIRVFEITYIQRTTSDQGCERSSRVYAGTFGRQGEYYRRRTEVSAIPAASELSAPPSCENYSHRSVFVEWRDTAGHYGHEEVHY